MEMLQGTIDYLRRHKAVADACLKGQDNTYCPMLRQDLEYINFTISILEELEENGTVSV